MLYFSKLRIYLVAFVTVILIFIASSNFLKFESDFLNKKIGKPFKNSYRGYKLLDPDLDFDDDDW